MKYNQFIKVPILEYQMNYPVSNYVMQNMPYFEAMAKAINEHFPGEKRLLCRGSSGSIIAGLLAPKVNPVEIVYISKGESRHSSNSTSFFGSSYAKNIIVDDLVSSGDTIRQIYREFLLHNPAYGVHGVVVSGPVDPNAYALQEVIIETLIAGSTC